MCDRYCSIWDTHMPCGTLVPGLATLLSAPISCLCMLGGNQGWLSCYGPCLSVERQSRPDDSRSQPDSATAGAWGIWNHSWKILPPPLLLPLSACLCLPVAKIFKLLKINTKNSLRIWNDDVSINLIIWFLLPAWCHTYTYPHTLSDLRIINPISLAM